MNYDTWRAGEAEVGQGARGSRQLVSFVIVVPLEVKKVSRHDLGDTFLFHETNVFC